MLVFGLFNLLWSIIVISLWREWQEIGMVAKIMVRVMVYEDLIITGMAVFIGVIVLIRKVAAAVKSFTRPKIALRQKIDIETHQGKQNI